MFGRFSRRDTSSAAAMRALAPILALALALAPSAGALRAPLEVWVDARGASLERIVARHPTLFDRALVAAADAAGAPPALPEPSLAAAAAVDGVSRLSYRGAGASAKSVAGASVVVDSLAAQRSATAVVGSVSWIHADARSGHPMICAENLLGASDGSGTRVACSVGGAADVAGLAFALDRGVDALVLDADADDATVDGAYAAKAARSERAADGAADAASAAARSGGAGAPPDLEAWTVTGVAEGGVADRVALDLTTLLGKREGCLVGSSAKALALVLGETATGGFVPPRPFRVNAGPVHAYCALADGATKYLEEVVAGDAVLVASAGGGAARAAVVGRCKVEPRPTLRVDLARGDRTANVFLQQAETVRLARAPDGAPLPVTAVAPGDEVLVSADDKGTHVGMRISVRVEER